jgi:hypothetical protein
MVDWSPVSYDDIFLAGGGGFPGGFENFPGGVRVGSFFGGFPGLSWEGGGGFDCFTGGLKGSLGGLEGSLGEGLIGIPGGLLEGFQGLTTLWEK